MLMKINGRVNNENEKKNNEQPVNTQNTQNTQKRSPAASG